MNKKQYQELSDRGITIVRSQFDSRRGMWKIVKMSWGECSHGWRRFGAAWHFTQQDADEKIERIINQECFKCVTEAMAEELIMQEPPTSRPAVRDRLLKRGL